MMTPWQMLIAQCTTPPPRSAEQRAGSHSRPHAAPAHAPPARPRALAPQIIAVLKQQPNPLLFSDILALLPGKHSHRTVQRALLRMVDDWQIAREGPRYHYRYTLATRKPS
jgi:hypothetical protein